MVLAIKRTRRRSAFDIVKFYSTRDRKRARVDLDTALAMGLAPDGGLFVPESLPRHDYRSWTAQSPAEVATTYLAPFFAESSLHGALPDIAAETFSFPLPVVPVSVAEGSASVLELFHGPTAAFKDVGARFLAACLTRLKPKDHDITILVATSGDTGGAVASAFHGKPGVRVVVLFPLGRVSQRQQQQLTCWGDNVTAIAVRGSFDDCQRMVKAAFVEPTLAEQYHFSSANSINIGRLLPQSAYYAYTSLHHHRNTGKPLSFVIPTGNLGNGLAAVLARASGMPIGDIRFATNANRTLPDYFASGEYEPRDSIATLASAMDVGAPSNLERLRTVFGEADALTGHGLDVLSIDDKSIAERIRSDAVRLPFVWCPHSATAMAAWLDLDAGRRDNSDWCLVATAHPAKFETIVEPLVGHTVEMPPALADLMDRPSWFATIDADLASLA
ncbi:MAG: threonine synthase, partial [Pseudomonadota bacterium]